MRKLRIRFILLLALLFGIFSLSAEVEGQTAKVKKSTIQSAKYRAAKKKTASKKSKKRTRKSKRRIRTRRVSPEKSLALLRQYLPELADIHKTNLDETDPADIRVGPGYDFRSPFADPELRLKLIRNIDRWLGTRYRFGGASKRGIDCSGFTSVVLSASMGKMFVGSSRSQAEKVEHLGMNELQFGDLMFFTGRNRNSQRVGHVGIYIGNGVFAHSSTGRGVIYTHISEGYYAERFLFGGRIISGDYTIKRTPFTDRL